MKQHSVIANVIPSGIGCTFPSVRYTEVGPSDYYCKSETEPETDQKTSFFFLKNRMWRMVLGLPIGDCAGSSNNLMPRGAKLSAIDVTPKIFFERLYWFQDQVNLSPESTVCVLTHPHCSFHNYFSILWIFFSQVAPHFWSAHDSPNNLAESRYPHVAVKRLCIFFPTPC